MARSTKPTFRTSRPGLPALARSSRDSEDFVALACTPHRPGVVDGLACGGVADTDLQVQGQRGAQRGRAVRAWWMRVAEKVLVGLALSLRPGPACPKRAHNWTISLPAREEELSTHLLSRRT